jgi:tetratricopeptide (TPR) repeat protein
MRRTALIAFALAAVLVLAARAAPTASAADAGTSAATGSETAAAKATAAKEQAAKQEAAACALAHTALDAGELRAAKSKYETLGEAKCAAGGLAVIRSCELGDAYRAQDKRSDAATAYKKALAEDPDAPCAIEGVEKPVARLPSRIATWITNALPTALTYAAVLLVALLLFLLAGYIRPVGRRLAHIPIIRKILSPRLTIAAIDDSGTTAKPGAAITARIKERLQRFREEALRDDQPDYQLDHGTGDEQFADLVSASDTLETALKNARELSDQTKILTALASLIYAALPIDRLTVNGAICTQDDKTAAGTFALERGAQLEAAVTITGPGDASDATGADFVALTDAAAAWVQYVVAQTLASKPFTPDQADSYALVQAGLRYQLEGKSDLAQHAYKSAIALNSENWAAHVNLAVTEARLGDGPAAAIPILREALNTMTNPA